VTQRRARPQASTAAMYFPRSEIEEWPMAYTPRCSR
jgi:hypothetical protein